MKKGVSVAFLDMSTVFDNVEHDHWKRTLQSLLMPDNLRTEWLFASPFRALGTNVSLFSVYTNFLGAHIFIIKKIFRDPRHLARADLQGYRWAIM